MKHQPPEISPPLFAARATDPHSSHAAAEEIESSGIAGRHRSLVYAEVRIRPGLTSDELAAKLGMDRHAVARRLPELERMGHIRRGEERKSSVGGRAGVTWFSTNT